MLRGLLFLSLSAALAVSTAASAQPSAVRQPDSPAAASAGKAVTHGDPNRKVCKTVTATGSRLGRSKVCKTAREWAEQQYQHQKDLERIQRPNTPDVG